MQVAASSPKHENGSDSDSGSSYSTGSSADEEDGAIAAPALDAPDSPASAPLTERPLTAESDVVTSDELLIRKVAENMKGLVAGRKPLVLVSTGAFNPIHLWHARMFYLARDVCRCKF